MFPFSEPTPGSLNLWGGGRYAKLDKEFERIDPMKNNVEQFLSLEDCSSLDLKDGSCSADSRAAQFGHDISSCFPSSGTFSVFCDCILLAMWAEKFGTVVPMQWGLGRSVWINPPLILQLSLEFYQFWWYPFLLFLWKPFYICKTRLWSWWPPPYGSDQKFTTYFSSQLFCFTHASQQYNKQNIRGK